MNEALNENNGKEMCSECNGTEIITDYKHGERICAGCGLVMEEKMFDHGPEWRAFDDEQEAKRARAGGPLKFAKLNKGLTTEIDRYDRDIRGGAIPPESKAQIYRLRKWQKRTRMSDSVHRNLSMALPELDRMCAHLNIPNNIKEECAQTYRKAVSKGVVRGRSIESVVAAIIYLVSRQHRLPKTLEELEEASGIKKKDIGRSYRTVYRGLGLRMPVITAMDYVERLASELKISGNTQNKAKEVLEIARDKGITSGKAPVGAAMAALHIAGELTGDENAPSDIIAFAGIPEATIRRMYDDLAKGVKPELMEN
ncbi:hypothetical protein BEH94_10420 [Candidatus Altiarchaeales archaeon WOR_SM1_SCG]|nr:hypothetical protein BEH94_10420 [Candidatus Altiarchaeales archaeon WOR_SM1_SCG]